MRLQLPENLLVVDPQEAADPDPLLLLSVLGNVDEFSDDIQHILIITRSKLFLILGQLAISC